MDFLTLLLFVGVLVWLFLYETKEEVTLLQVKGGAVVVAVVVCYERKFWCETKEVTLMQVRGVVVVVVVVVENDYCCVLVCSEF